MSLSITNNNRVNSYGSVINEKDVNKDWKATGSSQVVRVNDAHTKNNAMERFTVLQGYKTPLNKWTRAGELAAGVGKVVLIALAIASVAGVLIIGIILVDYGINIGLEKNFKRFWSGKKVTIQPLVATEKKIKELATKNLSGKIALAEFHFEKWARNQNNDNNLKSAMAQLKSAGDQGYSIRSTFLNTLPKLFGRVEKGSEAVLQYLDTLEAVYKRSSHLLTFAEILEKNDKSAEAKRLYTTASKSGTYGTKLVAATQLHQLNILGVE